MDFTREPIIETVITPKEGFKLAIRSSKNPGHEEFFVDAVEVVSFGSSLFFRSLERPKAFIVPVSDYEVLEVRETRLVLKNVGIDRSIKIAGGREGALKLPPKETSQDRNTSTTEAGVAEETGGVKSAMDVKGDRKRDRRRQNRRRRGRDDIVEVEGEESEERKEMEPVPTETQVKVKLPLSRPVGETSADGSTPPILSTLLPPPPMLISETMAQYRNNALFKEAFFLKNEEDQPHEAVCEAPCEEEVSIEAPEQAAPLGDQDRVEESDSQPEEQVEVTTGNESQAEMPPEQPQH